MERAVEWFIAFSALVMGASHVLRRHDWAGAFRHLHALGRPGALINGTATLAIGAAVVAGHRSWAWPGAVLTAFGWLLVMKGVVCLLAPEVALRSMHRGANSPRGFVAAGVMLFAIGGWACYCLWRGAI